MNTYGEYVNAGELQEYLAEHYLKGWGSGKGKLLIPNDSYIDGYPYQINSLPKAVKKCITNPVRTKLRLHSFNSDDYTAFDLTEFGMKQLKRYYERKPNLHGDIETVTLRKFEPA